MKNRKYQAVICGAVILFIAVAAGCEKDATVPDVPDSATLNELRTAFTTGWLYNDSLAVCLDDMYWLQQDSLSWADRVHFCDNMYHQYDAAFDQANVRCQQQIQAHTGSHHMGGNTGSNYAGYNECIGLHNALVQHHQLIHPHF